MSAFRSLITSSLLISTGVSGITDARTATSEVQTVISKDKTSISSSKTPISMAKALDTSDADPIHPVSNFHQRLLVCNACDGFNGVDVTRNEHGVKSGQPLGFNQCRYIDGSVRAGDRLNFKFSNEGVQGSFKVEELPRSDSVLLLIVQKRAEKDSDLLSFQSFAFAPTNADSDAQVAFLNAVPGDDSGSVRMKDFHLNNAVATREEKVNFDHVYAIEQGVYELESNSKPTKMALRKGQDYVVLKTGSKDQSQFLVFPQEDGQSEVARLLYMIAVAGPLAAVAIVFYMIVIQGQKNVPEVVVRRGEEVSV